VDEWLKFLALQQLPADGTLVNPGVLEFAIHKNLGIVFNIPFRLEFIIFVSILIGLGLFHIAYKNRRAHPEITFSCLVIVLGATGNLYDRLMYGFTVDYIILFGRSAINLSDLVILAGVVMLLLQSRRPTHRSKHLTTEVR
jgi:lipoprotein signal peptidase